MNKRVPAAALLPCVAALLMFGCERDPGEPSFPRVAAMPPTPEPTIPSVVHPVLRGIQPDPNGRLEPMRVGGDVTEPFAIVQVLPDCRALVGAPQPVAVELIVTVEGAVQGARVLSAVPEGAKALILQTVKGWRFRPATMNGRPVPVSYTIALRCAGS